MSGLEHVNFQTSITTGHSQVSDSSAANRSIFAALDIAIEAEPAILLESYEEIEKLYLARDPLTCLLSLGMKSGWELEVEF